MHIFPPLLINCVTVHYCKSPTHHDALSPSCGTTHSVCPSSLGSSWSSSGIYHTSSSHSSHSPIRALEPEMWDECFNVHMKALRHTIHSCFDLNVVMETLAYPCFFLWHHIRPGAGGWVLVSAASMDCVFAACTQITQLAYDIYTHVHLTLMSINLYI